MTPQGKQTIIYRSPFKFLDAYEKNDKDIFFGREKEIELLYNTTFKTNLMLVYGQSGTGKTSLIQCGLANRFRETDWFDIYIRRRKNINASLQREIRKKAVTPIEQGAAVSEAVQSLYLDFLKPVYLIFDQFEELFILGTKEEQQEFFKSTALLLKAPGGGGKKRVTCKIIFVMREEYIALLYDFEKVVPELFDNRIRVEPMHLSNVEGVIRGSASAFEIRVDQPDETVKQIIDNNKDKKGTVQLPYLQVYLDRLYKEAEAAQPSNPIIFTPGLVAKIGKISDVMAVFLDEQTEQVQQGLNLEHPDAPDESVWQVLNQFATVEGTSLPMQKEILYLKSPLREDIINYCLTGLEKARILRLSEKDKTYEIAHDALAQRIDDKRSVEEKTFLKIEKLVKDRFDSYKDTAALLTKGELNYIEPYEEKLKSKLDDGEIKFIVKSKKKVSKRRRVFAVSIAATIFILLLFAFFAFWQWKIAEKNYNRSESLRLIPKAQEKVKEDPTIALRIVEVAWQLDKNETVNETIREIYLKNRFYKTVVKPVSYTISAAISADGKYILTGSGDNAAKLWDMEGNELPVVFKGHSKEITSVAFSPDGKHILTGSKDETARLWDRDGTGLKVLKDHNGWVTSVAFSQDGKSILTCSLDGTAWLWDLQGNEKQIFEDIERSITSAAISPDGKTILTGYQEGAAQLWDVKGTKLQDFTGHKDEVTSVAFSPHGKSILTGSKDKTARLWDIQGKKLQDFIGHKNEVTSVAFSPDGEYILTGSKDKTARLWDIQGKKLQDFIGHEEEIIIALFWPDGKYILTGSPDKTIRLWDIKDIISQVLEKHAAAANVVAISPDGNYILTGCQDGTVNLRDIKGKKSKAFRIHEDGVTSAAFSPDGKYILTGSEDKTARLWDSAGNPIQDFKIQHKDVVTSVAFSPDGKYILTGSRDKPVRIWDLQKNSLQLQITGDKLMISAVAFSPDGKYIFTGSEYGSAQLWNVKGNPLYAFTAHEFRITSAAFSPDSKSILTGSLDTTARLWDLKGKALQTFRNHTSFVYSVAFSPGGKYILTASKDKTARLWDLEGNEVQVFKGHSDWINSAAYSPDGKYIITGSRDKTVRKWEIRMPFDVFLQNGVCEALSKKEKQEYGIED